MSNYFLALKAMRAAALDAYRDALQREWERDEALRYRDFIEKAEAFGRAEAQRDLLDRVKEILRDGRRESSMGALNRSLVVSWNEALKYVENKLATLADPPASAGEEPY
jgi:hypothetical protein